MADNETTQIHEDIKTLYEFDEAFATACVDEWNKRQEEIDAEFETTDKKKKTHMLMISGLDKKNILLKLKNKKQYKFKFPCDSYYTTFKLVENQLFAYEPNFPTGREVKSSEEMEEKMGKPVFDFGKFGSPRGFFLINLAKFGYATNDATAIANGFGFNSESPITSSLLAICLANFLDKHKMTLVNTKKGFGLVCGADDEQQIEEKMKTMHLVMRSIKGIKAINSNYTN